MTAGVRIWSDLNSKKVYGNGIYLLRHPSLPGIKVEEVSGEEKIVRAMYGLRWPDRYIARTARIHIAR